MSTFAKPLELDLHHQHNYTVLSPVKLPYKKNIVYGLILLAPYIPKPNYTPPNKMPKPTTADLNNTPKIIVTNGLILSHSLKIQLNFTQYASHYSKHAKATDIKNNLWNGQEYFSVYRNNISTLPPNITACLQLQKQPNERKKLMTIPNIVQATMQIPIFKKRCHAMLRRLLPSYPIRKTIFLAKQTFLSLNLSSNHLIHLTLPLRLSEKHVCQTTQKNS